MRAGSGSLSPYRQSHPEVPEDAEPRPPGALRPRPGWQSLSRGEPLAEAAPSPPDIWERR